ncbi:MAG: hypothetical protein N2Z40_00435 [Caldimicrobium sp.]|nr:hypothetical protein [Caldimicrobium sp.]MCX7612679.1 hypothetical protein [Caldimicrobium sp.]MDW8182167.1 hypothetical protein [Caldimicrobium sp.]
MYISRKITPIGYVYRINESYYEAPFYKSRVLFDLGSNPANFITYYSEVAFSIDLEDELAKIGKKTDQFQLEELFLRFLNPEAQKWVRFSLSKRQPKNTNRRDFNLDDIHWFDRIRLIAIKLDHRDPKRLIQQKYPFFERLLFKSRDEIENMIWDMEDRLTFREKSRYLLSIFSLGKASSPEERDTFFMEGLCKIAEDPQYFMDLSSDKVLSSYLSRYVWFYFDAIPRTRVPRSYHVFEESLYLEVSRNLNISVDKLLSLSKREVLKIFRAKILELHPDRGGSHEAFVKVRKLMEDFLKIRF